MIKKLIYLLIMIAVFCSTNPLSDYEKLFPVAAGANSGDVTYSDITEQYKWAEEAIYYFTDYGILSGMGDNKFEPSGLVTNEQVAKIIVLAFKLKADVPKTPTFVDIASDRWSYPYIETARNYFIRHANQNGQKLFCPTQNPTREEIIYSVIKARGYTDSDLKDINVLARFTDYGKVSAEYKVAMAIAVEQGIVKGDAGTLRPDTAITRAEIAVLMHRIVVVDNPTVTETPTPAAAPTPPTTETATLPPVETPTPTPEPTPVPIEPIVGNSKTNIEQMKKWAENRGAHQRFIDIAEVYVKYGELTGIRAEVLYCQAAKETNFGKYTGNVKPEQNNWAGIKIKSPTGDKTEDHETFSTPEEGVRAQFNHMAAYVGIRPVGDPHDRYYVVSSLSWAGTIKYVEELGGRWAPDLDYGRSIIEYYMKPLLDTKS